jgi:hypothetical protein
MNRRIGTLFLTALAFSVLWNPGTANTPAPPAAVNGVEEVSRAGQASLSPTRPPAAGNTAEFVSTQCLPDCPAQDLFDVVQDFYGTRGQVDDDTLKHLGIPYDEREKVEYLLALVPDPVHTLVGSRASAILRRFRLAVAPRFLWECLISRTVSWVPAPATSNPSCRFPAMGLPVCFPPRVM